MTTAATTFDLNILGTATVDGIDYTVYNDGAYSSVVLTDEFDAEPRNTDYSLWCSEECSEVGDLALVRCVLAAAGIPAITSACHGGVTAEPPPQERIDNAATLDDLCATLRGITSDEVDEVDASDLPTFGGDEPADTDGIWSWDAGRVLRHSVDVGWYLEARDAD